MGAVVLRRPRLSRPAACVSAAGLSLTLGLAACSGTGKKAAPPTTDKKVDAKVAMVKTATLRIGSVDPESAGPDIRVQAVTASQVLRESAADVVTVVAAGVTVFEALKAYETLKASGTPIRVIDLYSVAPVDRASLIAAGRATGRRLITVEDHYEAGGIGDAVADAVADAGLTVRRLAVREIPRSGKPEELLDRFGISASHIVEAVRAAVLTPA